MYLCFVRCYCFILSSCLEKMARNKKQTLCICLTLKSQQPIKDKLLFSIYSQLRVVQYGEFGRWPHVRGKVGETINSPNTLHILSAGWENWGQDTGGLMVNFSGVYWLVSTKCRTVGLMLSLSLDFKLMHIVILFTSNLRSFKV